MSRKTIIADLRKYGRNLSAKQQRETSITPSLLLAAADLLEQDRVWHWSKGHGSSMCGHYETDEAKNESLTDVRANVTCGPCIAIGIARKHCMNPETCNPDKGADGCVCTCQSCKENPLSSLPPGVRRWRDIRRPLPEERVPTVATYAPDELRQLMIAAVEWATGSKTAEEDRAKQQRLRSAAEAYAKDAQQPELREARALSFSPDKMLDDLCGVLGGRAMWHECIGRVRRLVSLEREIREKEQGVKPCEHANAWSLSTGRVEWCPKCGSVRVHAASSTPPFWHPPAGGTGAKCGYSDCTETKDLQTSFVCLAHLLRDEETYDRALANAFWDVLCTLEGYKYIDWELVADDADEEDPSRKLAERTEALIKEIISDVKTTAKALGVKPAPREELTKPSKETP